MKGAFAVSTPRECKFLRNIEPPLPAPSSGDGDGELHPQREPSPARAAEGAVSAREGTACSYSPPEASPSARVASDSSGTAAKTINLLALDVNFVCAHNAACISLILAAFCIACCIR